MESTNTTEKLSLESFSDQHFEISSACLNHLILETREYQIEELIECVEKDTLEMMSNLLDDTLGILINGDMDNRDIDVLSNTLANQVSKWREESMKRVLDVVLIKKIIENREYLNENITAQLLQLNFKQQERADLAFIWLFGLRNKLQAKK